MQAHPLDNPIYNALRTIQQPFSAGTPAIKKYAGDTLPFMGMNGTANELLPQIAPYCLPEEEIFLKDENHEIPTGWAHLNSINSLQMVYENPQQLYSDNAEHVSLLTPADTKDLIDLVMLVQPGFFKKKTALLGDYYGIKKDGKLVACAGERFKLPGYTELSAICTHPEHTGKGYARQLIQKLCMEHSRQGNISFLHVVDTNVRAIQLYQHLGFTKRIDFPLIKIKKL